MCDVKTTPAGHLSIARAF